METTYTKERLDKINYSYPWNGSIINSNESKSKENNTYKLYATGDANISQGRIYVSLPSNIKITDEIRRKYNLM